MEQKGKGNRDEISFDFFHFPFPIECIYILKLFRGCAFAM